MPDYLQYKPEDFATDASFRRWKLHHIQEDTIFWTEFQAQNLHKTGDIQNAVKLLEGVFERYDRVSDEQVHLHVDYILDKIRENDSTAGRPSAFMYFYKTAAAAVVLLTIGLLAYFKWLPQTADRIASSPETKAIESSLYVRQNTTVKKMTILLPDGSSVVLQPAARISFPNQFSAAERRVYLTGEAFFEVAKDTTHPFFVVGQKLIAKVVGTSFSVVSPQDGPARVLVETGKVSVFPKSVKHSDDLGNLQGGVLLSPDEQLVVVGPDQTYKSATTSASDFCAPREKFRFNATPIAAVFARLEATYGIDIQFDDQVMKNCYISASLDDEPYLEKLQLICVATGSEFVLTGKNQIRITSNGCNF